MHKTRIVITGLGPVTPIGIGVSDVWAACLEGRSGIKTILSDDNSPFRLSIAGTIPDFNPAEYFNAAKFSWMDRFAHFAVVAAKLALADAGISLECENPRKIGVIFGSCLGGMLVGEEQLDLLNTKGPKRVRPKLVPANTLNSAAGEIAIAFGLKGPNLSVSTSYMSSATALGLAYDVFQLYDLDIVVAGGMDAPLGNLTSKSLLGTTKISRKCGSPFDLNRDGFALSEGGAVLVMESLAHALKRSAPIYAEYAGYGQTRNVSSTDAKGLIRAARQALDNDAISQEEVDYIQAHGAATQEEDRLETKAIKELFGEKAYRIPISAAKSMIGHTIGGAGAIDAAICALTIRDGVVAPTINYTTPDPTCDLDYVPNKKRKVPVRAALVNALSLNGDCFVVFMKKVRI